MYQIQLQNLLSYGTCMYTNAHRLHTFWRKTKRNIHTSGSANSTLNYLFPNYL